MIAQLSTAVLVGLGVLAALVAVWVFAPALQGASAARKHLGSHRLAVGSIVVVYLANVLLTIPFAGLFRGAGGLTGDTFLVAALATQGPMLAIVFFRVIVPGAASWRDLGLKLLPAGELIRRGLLTGMGSVVLVIGIGTVLNQFGITQNQMEGQFNFVRGLPPQGFVLMLAIAGVIAPAIEELFFRGYLFGSYVKKKPAWVAYLASGLMFALLHADPSTMNTSQAFGLMVPIFALGTLFAWTFRQTGSLLPGMVAHSFNNCFSLVVLYVLGVS